MPRKSPAKGRKSPAKGRKSPVKEKKSPVKGLSFNGKNVLNKRDFISFVKLITGKPYTNLKEALEESHERLETIQSWRSGRTKV
jgi:hypothetical protein